jgi:hypothetical protein
MHANEFWIALFRRIPSNLHDSLSLGLTTGTEIVVLKIIRLESEFMITRGRVAGTSDPSRIIMIPYSQFTHVSITRELSEADVDAIFGKGDTPPVMAIPGQAESAVQPAAPAPEFATVNDAPAGVNPPKKKDAPSKTILLAKLRDRLKDSPTIKK